MWSLSNNDEYGNQKRHLLLFYYLFILLIHFFTNLELSATFF